MVDVASLSDEALLARRLSLDAQLQELSAELAALNRESDRRDVARHLEAQQAVIDAGLASESYVQAIGQGVTSGAVSV